MSSIHPDNVDKPVELIKPDSLPLAERKHIGKALEAVVDYSALALFTPISPTGYTHIPLFIYLP